MFYFDFELFLMGAVGFIFIAGMFFPLLCWAYGWPKAEFIDSILVAVIAIWASFMARAPNGFYITAVWILNAARVSYHNPGLFRKKEK